MTETETPAALPDEDRLAFPDSWKRFVRPRRDYGKPRKLKFDAEAGRGFLEHHEERVRARLGLAVNEEYREAGLAFLDGRADVLGAGAVMALALPAVGGVAVQNRPLFDHIAAEHGLPFAVAAVTEALTFEASQSGANNGIGISRLPLNSIRWSNLVAHKEIREIRVHLAALPDAEHAAVTAALAERRTSPAHRLVASVLLADRQDWLDEVCAEVAGGQWNRTIAQLLAEVIATGGQYEALTTSASPFVQVHTAELADLLHRLGAAALPEFSRLLGGYWFDTNEKKTLYRALTAIPTTEAMRTLLDRLDDPHAMGFAMQAAANFPKRALSLIANRLDADDITQGEYQRLTAILYSDPILLEAALPRMHESVRTSIEQALGDHRRLPEAPLEAVPALIASPPWEGHGPDRDPVILKGLTPPGISRLVWAEGEQEEWAKVEANLRFWQRSDWEKEVREFDGKGAQLQAGVLAYGPVEAVAALVPRWKSGGDYYDVVVLKRLLARFGEDMIDRVVAAQAPHSTMREVQLPIANLVAARYAADALVRLKTMRPFAVEWLGRHAADAAALLIPDALGKSKKLRSNAEAALRFVASTHGADVVRAAATQYGEEAAEAIGALVDIDPLMPVGVKIPVPGAWASAAALPQLLLEGRELAIPNALVRNAITVLALSTPEYEYPGLNVLADACDRISLARFSLALFEQWLLAGAPSEDAWALTQLAHFADDEAVRVLHPLIAKWPGENQHHRAVRGLKVLGAIGTETALRAIHQIAEKSKFAAISDEAGEQIDAIAEDLGLNYEQLGDRLVPDFGLREESAVVFDYGPRQFRVGFDETLKPFAIDMDGKHRKTLPKPGAKDDELLAGAAYKRFAALRKDLRTVAADQVKRLERAMVFGRTWTPAEFDEHFVQHPLVWHLARRLVWMADIGGAPTAFRLAEDKEYTDVDEQTLEIPADAVIRLAHPVLLGDQTAAWAEILADYEVLQPFSQLERPVMAFTEEELRTGRLKRFEGITVPVGNLLGLTSKGWHRSGPLDAGIEPGLYSTLPGVGYLVIDLDPGIWVGAVDEHPEQTMRTVLVSERFLDDWRVPGPKRDFGPVDPVTASEALAALAKAAGLA